MCLNQSCAKIKWSCFHITLKQKYQSGMAAIDSTMIKIHKKGGNDKPKINMLSACINKN